MIAGAGTAAAAGPTTGVAAGRAPAAAAGGGTEPAPDATGPPGDSASPGDSGRLVTIDGNRRVYLECRGTGSPTVVLVSGTGGAADEWTSLADPGDPKAVPKPSTSAVLPRVAGFTRVCAYDRPGTTRADGSPTPSTPVPQPTSARAGADDLRAVLSAAGEHGPYVLVGASWGAMITGLLARADAPRVVGLVTVDGASVHLRDTLTPAQWSDWMRKAAALGAENGVAEVPDYESAVREVSAAPPLRHPPPAVVLTSDEPWDLKVGHSGSTWPAWLAAQQRLAAELHARRVTDTHSGHGIAVEQPRLVSEAVREVVDRARGR
ncbi:alpha/beta hydrolase [Streptomyces sp. NPDC089799]|uniref:alpha/beta fold hydrolase n=1 Tax=Streptomyces sp. NPDC089799 TaxID=3155066 RepID=UPI0034140D32